MLEINKNYCGDTIELMKQMDAESTQLILTSPPYNASIRKDNHKYPGGNYEDDLSDEEYVEWSVKIFKEYYRILKDTGVVAYNMSYTTFSPTLPYMVIAAILKETDFMIADTLAWKKRNAVPLSGHPNRLTRICEFVYIFVKKDHIEDFECNKIVSSLSNTGQRYFKTYYNYLETRNNDGATEIHKATYSSDFAKYFIDLYSFPGSLVVDNFMGTGTSAVGCIDLGRNWIGMDLSQEYVNYANERISKHIPDPTSIHTPKETPLKDNRGGAKKSRKQLKMEFVEPSNEVIIEDIKIEEKKDEGYFWD